MSKGVTHKYTRFLGDPLCALSGHKYGRLLQRTSSRNTGDSRLGGVLLQSIIELVLIEQSDRSALTEQAAWGILLVNGLPIRCLAAVHSPDARKAMGRVCGKA